MELCDEWKRGDVEEKKTGRQKNRRGGEEDRKTKGFHDENLPSTRQKNSMETHIPTLTRNQNSPKPNAAQPTLTRNKNSQKPNNPHTHAD